MLEVDAFADGVALDDLVAHCAFWLSSSSGGLVWCGMYVLDWCGNERCSKVGRVDVGRFDSDSIKREVIEVQLCGLVLNQYRIK